MEKDKNYQKFCDEYPSENENNLQTFIFINQDNPDIPDDDDKINRDGYDPNTNSNQIRSENKRHKPKILFTTTKYPTENYRKKNKTSYGKWENYQEHNNFNEYPKPINPFFIKNKEIYDMTYQNFSENVANFISGMVIELKKVIVDFGQRRINKMILDDEIDNTKYELRFIDYYKFCVPHSKEFNERYLEKKLEYLFTEFQAPGYGTNRDQNKDVIKYIRDNYGKQLFANHFLDNNFYELVNEFVKNGLNKYLETKNNEQKKSYIRNNIVNYGKRIDAFNQIITTLCNNFKEYSTSF